MWRLLPFIAFDGAVKLFGCTQLSQIFLLHLPVCLRRTAILERCLRRLEFDKARDAEAKAQADQLEAERMAMQSIDW